MPMSFPDFDSLKKRAQQRHFRQPAGGETEEVYRTAFADFMLNVDSVEASEIRTGKNWGQWNEAEQFNALTDHLGLSRMLRSR